MKQFFKFWLKFHPATYCCERSSKFGINSSLISTSFKFQKEKKRKKKEKERKDRGKINERKVRFLAMFMKI